MGRPRIIRNKPLVCGVKYCSRESGEGYFHIGNFSGHGPLCSMHYQRLVAWGRYDNPPHKAHLKPTESPTIPNIHWAAGFLEGEGSFNTAHGTLTVQAAQVNREPLSRLREMFGGNIYFQKRHEDRVKFLNASDFYRWAVFGRRAERVVMLIYRDMSQRRKRQICKEFAQLSVRTHA